MIQSALFGSGRKAAIAPNTPFEQACRKLWLPDAMVKAPELPVGDFGPPQKRSALLINPFYAKDPNGSFGKHVLTPTLALTSVAAATPGDWKVECWDENLLQGPPPCEPIPEVVGITVHLTFARRAYELAAWYRARGAKVILGGLHVISCPDEAAQHADALAMGNGVPLWPRILNDAANNRLKARYEAPYGTDYASEPAPRRDLMDRRSFLTTTSMIATRGCNNRCGFCYLSTKGLTTPHAVREVRQVVGEFIADAQPYGVFTDNNLGADRSYLRELCRGLRPAEKIWSAAVTLDVTDDPSLVREMALAGCTGVFIGFETLSDQNLREARKQTPRPADYARRVGIFHDNGIQVNGSFVVGFDDDRKDTFATLARWIEETRLECATFHILTPYPGTPLFRKLEAEGRLLHKDWSRYDTSHAVFRPKWMTPEELEQGYGWLYERLFSHGSIWRRHPRDARAVLPYLAMAYLYKKANPLWYWLIRLNVTQMAWRPVVEWTRWRHLAFRRRLEERGEPANVNDAGGLRQLPGEGGLTVL